MKEKKRKIGTAVIILTVVAVLTAAWLLLLTKVLMPKDRYNRAMGLIDAGRYNEAYVMLEELGKADVIAENKYDRAVALLDAGDVKGAYELFYGLRFGDSEEKRLSIRQEYEALLRTRVRVGGTIVLGAYEQDGDESNGKEDIEWLVLDKEGGRALVISKVVLDAVQFDSEKGDVTWETCSLRRWLNDTFLKTAFDDDERALIHEVTVKAEANEDFEADPGRDTQDSVFLLSISEEQKFFSENEGRCFPSAYACGRGVDTEAVPAEEGGPLACIWALRTSGENLKTAAFVHYLGTVSPEGKEAGYAGFGLRPAMWVELDRAR